MKALILALIAAILLSGCSSEPVSQHAHAAGQLPLSQELVHKEAAVLHQEPPAPPSFLVLQPEPLGLRTEQDDNAIIDYSSTADGYIMARYHGQTDKRLKMRLFGPTTTYTYDLPLGQWTVFPLSDGDGEYRLTLYRQTSGSRYSMVLSATVTVELTDEFAPFLRPNQYVNYQDSPLTMEQGAQLCAGLTDPLQKVAAVYDYVVSTLSYDTEKAETVTSGYLPVLDEILLSGKGICFDYAALMAAMLRSQQVPCKLVVGYAGNIYHAWISVWTQENGWVDGAIFFDGESWKRMDPTFASYGQRSEEIMDFIEHGSYTAKYLY